MQHMVRTQLVHSHDVVHLVDSNSNCRPFPRSHHHTWQSAQSNFRHSPTADKTSNITRSKYRCPGCDARTCSLECYKRHQSRALCTGKRDPAKFIKKSQLVTPAGIDHDFNFITSVERGLERAEREVNGRGLGAAPEVRKEARRGEVSARDFSAAGVTVVRAPKGLSRQKENKTHRSGQR